MLKIYNLSKTYRKSGKKAVDNLSLTVERGELMGFIGQNGTGKTTTLRCVTGALSFEQGEIEIAGHSIVGDPLAAKQQLAYLPDNPDLYDFLTGLQYVNYIADIYRVPVDLRQQRLQYFAALLEMTVHLGDLISSYSHGMKQKLSLIAAFIHEPQLMVLDEPFVGLDPVASANLKREMRKLCDRGGAIFFSTHILEVAEKLCDTIAIIQAGRLVAAGPVHEVTGDTSLEQIFLSISGRGEAAHG